MKILVVDDDKIIRMGLKKIINRLFPEYEVVSECQNGLAAFEYLQANKVDLVITDIKMPIMTGSELIEKAVAELKDSPVFIVLSGYDEFTYVRDTMKLGALNYLLKPIKQDELKKVIQEVIIKIKEKRQKDKVLSKSIEVLKRDFFKHILFSNVEQSYKISKALLEGIQLNENYIYKLIVTDRSSEDKELVKSFIKEIINKYNYIEYIYFNFEGNLYIVFYLNAIENSHDKDIEKYIEDKTDIFIENNKNVFIMESINQVHRLKEQSRKFRELKETIHDGKKVRKYSLKLLEEKEIKDSIEGINPNLTVIKLAKRYIINNFNKNITLQEVADEVFLSQNYLSELFKREVGEGFYEFLTDYRIKVSKELLTKTNLKVYEIARRVGYNDAITFGRAFKKITGLTPNSFRNSKNV
ncbi:response regulator transcription factor [Clostridium sartagoforme]|uniref:response regulator transcription factor n=1 Tax=Clostridium sartagoforme TaxID=84031 RepID=UPI0031DE001E